MCIAAAIRKKPIPINFPCPLIPTMMNPTMHHIQVIMLIVYSIIHAVQLSHLIEK